MHLFHETSKVLSPREFADKDYLDTCPEKVKSLVPEVGGNSQIGNFCLGICRTCFLCYKGNCWASQLEGFPNALHMCDTYFEESWEEHWMRSPALALPPLSCVLWVESLSVK